MLSTYPWGKELAYNPPPGCYMPLVPPFSYQHPLEWPFQVDQERECTADEWPDHGIRVQRQDNRSTGCNPPRQTKTQWRRVDRCTEKKSPDEGVLWASWGKESGGDELGRYRPHQGLPFIQEGPIEAPIGREHKHSSPAPTPLSLFLFHR